jgi:outer membrane murein-binding lipoprotein Lpp
MRFTVASLGAVAVASLVFAGCADTPDPVEPGGTIDAAAAQAQDRLPAWFAQASPAVLALPGTVFADHDEANNRLLFGVESDAVIPGVRRVLRALGIPDAVVAIEVTAPIYQMATLRDRWRPTQGGIQIHFGQYVCTLGFNGDESGGRSFYTNSHCTDKQGGTEGTQYYQPTSSVDGTVIATEAEDPQYFRGGACPRGKKCRYSDAARALYSSGVESTRGAIAKTSGPNNGSLEVTGTFTITSQDATTTSFASGTTVNKVGRTTGWTQGSTGNTCVNVNVSGSNITQLCQTLVTSSAVIVGGGDSGSGVFRITSGDNVQLVGILWGGSSDGKMFVFSPLKNIIQELGSLTATN